MNVVDEKGGPESFEKLSRYAREEIKALCFPNPDHATAERHDLRKHRAREGRARKRLGKHHREENREGRFSGAHTRTDTGPRIQVPSREGLLGDERDS